jgi:GNAT superfamily N-acetyltransferase
MSEAPANLSMVRDDQKKSNNGIIIESLTEKHFKAARKIENDFLGAGKGCCFGALPFWLCPLSAVEFEATYRMSPDRCKTYGVAIREEDQLVVGICKLRVAGQPSKWDESFFHKIKDDNECYLDTMAVTKEAQGKGVGTKLMNWAEDVAKARQKTKMCLGVVNGNPARRLYERKGYVEVGKAGILVSLMLGRPNGQYGGVLMEKPLSNE